MAQQPLLRMHTDFEPKQRQTLGLAVKSSLSSTASSAASSSAQALVPQLHGQQSGGDGGHHQQQQQRYTPTTTAATAAAMQYANPPTPDHRVLYYDPQRGPEGTAVTVLLQTPYHEKQLKLGFGSLVVDTRQFNNPEHTSLNANVPSFSLTKSYTTRVPVNLIVLDDDGVVIARLPLGDFNYESNPVKSAGSGDRKRSTDAIYDTDIYGASSSESAKRIGLDMVRPKEEDSYLIGSANYPSYYQTSSAIGNPYASTIQMPQRGFFNDVSSIYGYPAQAQYVYTSAVSAASTPAIAGLGLGIADLTSTSSAANLSSLPAVSSAYLSHTSGADSASIVASAAEVSPILTSYSTNPYATLLNKANLKIQGTMEDMSANWTSEEWDNRRRLVQFWRRQEGNDIFCTFAPVAPSERQPNSIVVSCIYWHEKGECYITSVDTIMLLESLIGVRFTVEEKNRIRRNLEGFRPITVSKCKSESAEFFKLIMSFPNPKPRNIEKDVKVFPWAVLPYALKKIISKYTASYSSTASVNVEAIQNSAYPVHITGSSDSYGSTVEATSPIDASPLPASPHVVASQSSRTGSISPLPSQQQATRVAYGHHHQQQQQQSSAYDTLSTYNTSPHPHTQQPQYGYGYRHLSPRHLAPYAATAEHLSYDDEFQSGASHGGSHVSTPHTLSPWGGAGDE